MKWSLALVVLVVAAAAEADPGRLVYSTEGNNLRRYDVDSLGSPPLVSDGTLYYADLDLVGVFPSLGPGPDGKVWRIRFDALGDPMPPEQVRSGLRFPDGVAVLAGDLEPLEWRSYAGGSSRTRASSSAARSPTA